jgi:hypothetical protein
MTKTTETLLNNDAFARFFLLFGITGIPVFEQVRIYRGHPGIVYRTTGTRTKPW